MGVFQRLCTPRKAALHALFPQLVHRKLLWVHGVGSNLSVVNHKYQHVTVVSSLWFIWPGAVSETIKPLGCNSRLVERETSVSNNRARHTVTGLGMSVLPQEHIFEVLDKLLESKTCNTWLAHPFQAVLFRDTRNRKTLSALTRLIAI